MTENKIMIEDFFDNAGFQDRVIIGIYDENRIYFHVKFTDELANGMISMSLIDDGIYEGLKQLKHNLEQIIDRVDNLRPSESSIH